MEKEPTSNRLFENILQIYFKCMYNNFLYNDHFQNTSMINGADILKSDQ